MTESDGSVSAGMSIVTDVTELKERERELRRQNEQLDQVASAISHDLRNPLNVASGRAELAEETGDLSHLEEVHSAHDRMEAIIEDVLTLARQGEHIGETEPLDLAEVARRAWDHVSTDGGSLTVRGSATVVADERRLMQVFENLFRNSVEHGPANGETGSGDALEDDAVSPDSAARNKEPLTRGQTASDAASPTAGAGQDSADDASEDAATAIDVEVGFHDDGFYVADGGVGIPTDEREAILEPGYTTSDGGTGLGLAIVTNIAKAHGWSVDVGESETGGARFEFHDVDRAGDGTPAED